MSAGRVVNWIPLVPRIRRRKKCARRALVAPWVHSKLEPGVALIGLDRSLGLFAGGYPMKESFEFSIIDFSGFSSYMHLHAPDVQPDLFPARERLLQPCCWSLALLCSRTFLEAPVAVRNGRETDASRVDDICTAVVA